MAEEDVPMPVARILDPDKHWELMNSQRGEKLLFKDNRAGLLSRCGVLLMLIQLPTTNHAYTLPNTSSRARNTIYPAVHHFGSFSESRPTLQLRDFTRQNKADPCFQQTKTRLPYPKHIASNATPSHPQCLPYVSPRLAASGTSSRRVKCRR